jgi:hypothetical protein
VARQGPDREWHFAHSPKGAYVKVSKECEYSVYVSIALMAKQLFMSCNSIFLPEYAVTLNGRGEVTGERHSIEVTVTKSSVVDIESCKVETDINGLNADILTSVKGMPLLFYLTHPERRLSLGEASFHGQSIGVVSIDLTLVPQLLRQASGSKGGYKSELAKFLFDDCSGKQWIYHPRKEGELLQGNDRLKVLCEERGVKMLTSKAFFSPHRLVIPEELKQPENPKSAINASTAMAMNGLGLTGAVTHAQNVSSISTQEDWAGPGDLDSFYDKANIIPLRNKGWRMPCPVIVGVSNPPRIFCFRTARIAAITVYPISHPLACRT